MPRTRPDSVLATLPAGLWNCLIWNCLIDFVALIESAVTEESSISGRDCLPEIIQLGQLRRLRWRFFPWLNGAALAAMLIARCDCRVAGPLLRCVGAGFAQNKQAFVDAAEAGAVARSNAARDGGQGCHDGFLHPRHQADGAVKLRLHRKMPD